MNTIRLQDSEAKVRKMVCHAGIVYVLASGNLYSWKVNMTFTFSNFSLVPPISKKSQRVNVMPETWQFITILFSYAETLFKF